MNVDRIYQLMGSAFKRVYGYYIKRPIQRFNVDNRAEKLMEKEKTIPKVAPRHENTDQLFQELIEKNPHFRKELNEKREDLLKRLNTVKVVSKDREISEQELKETEEIRERIKSRLPQSRQGVDIPIHAYIEPQKIPKGRVSLLSALNFIGKHWKNPEEYDSNSISRQYQLNEEEVKHILDYFKPFYKDSISDPIEDTERVLGIPKQQFDDIIAFLKPRTELSNEQMGSSGDKKSDESQIKSKIESRDK